MSDRDRSNDLLLQRITITRALLEAAKWDLHDFCHDAGAYAPDGEE